MTLPNPVMPFNAKTKQYAIACTDAAGKYYQLATENFKTCSAVTEVPPAQYIIQKDVFCKGQFHPPPQFSNKEMISIIEKFLPQGKLIAALALPVTLLALLAACLSGWMKMKCAIRTPYTRKTFHCIIFTAAGLLQYYYGLQAVCLMGGIVFIMVLIAVAHGRSWFYRSLARETDRPYEKWFILLPLLATAVGGIVSNVFFSSAAPIGYFVAGWGDAVGEPVGARWGRHRYAASSLFGVKTTRSIEGSAAVMLVSALVTFVCIVQMSAPVSYTIALAVSFVLGVAAAFVEAISSHGMDNLTMQVCTSGLLYWLLHIL